MEIIDEELSLTDLISASTLQKMQDAFSMMTGIAALVTDANGNAVTKPSGFHDFCTKYIQETENGKIMCGQCYKDETEKARLVKDTRKPCRYFCHAGLMAFSAPIMAGKRMAGCFIGGQVLTKPLGKEQILETARRTGACEKGLIDAAESIKVMDQAGIDRAAAALYDIANVLSEVAGNKNQIYFNNLQLEKASHMKSDFLANMSHEIRTPMNAVIGMAEMALREDISPAARGYIRQIKSSGQSLLTIINDILDFSKIESGKMDINEVDYEPMSVINDVVNIIMTRIGNKKVELTLDINPGLPHELHGDNIRIKQVLVNLANNAVKFTSKGNVHIEMDFKYVKDNEIMLYVSISDTGSGIKKEDMKKLFKSFQQVDSKRNRNIEGTGLGLAICKQLVSLMGGEIQAESVYGKGSKFTFRIPQKVTNTQPSIDRIQEKTVAACLVTNTFIKKEMKKDLPRFGALYYSLSSEEELYKLEEENIPYLFVEQPLFTDNVQDFLKNHPNISGIVLINFRSTRSYNIPNVRVIKKPLYTLSMAGIFHGDDVYSGFSQIEADDFDFTAPEAEILVVDDNSVNLTVVQGLLNPLDMNIETALSGKEAVNKVINKKYDIIFMDHMMPEMDGVETTRVIRRMLGENGQVPIIALTANAVDGTRELFIREGMDDFVTKPIELRIIISKLKKWLPKEKIIREKKESSIGSQAGVENNTDIQITGLDVQSAMKLLGREELFWSVLKEYYRVIDKKYGLIKEYEQNEQWKEYTVEVHGLKSASRQVGADMLAEEAEQMEAAGNSEDAELIHKATPLMLERYIQYKDILKPYFTNKNKEQAGRQADIKKLKEFFARMETALENLDTDDMEEVICDMEKYSYCEEHKEYFEKLKNAVEDIDTEQCEEILAAWKICAGKPE
ncbi:MAG: response regulator [Lachnospiraceae bacterium]|nr:response regulator [Lachnospiraceae bacterium]